MELFCLKYKYFESNILIFFFFYKSIFLIHYLLGVNSFSMKQNIRFPLIFSQTVPLGIKQFDSQL